MDVIGPKLKFSLPASLYLLIPIGLYWGNRWVLPVQVESSLSALESVLLGIEMATGQMPKNLKEAMKHSSVRDAGPYDPYGQLYDLITFRGGNFILRSFGSDGEENTPLKNLDPSRSKLMPIKAVHEHTQNFIQPDSSHFFLPPAPLLAQSTSKDGLWSAQRYSLSETSINGRLIVRSLDPKRSSMILVCPDSNVTEFLWLPNSKSIVYIVEQSDHSRLKVWNLYSGEITTIEISSPKPGLQIGSELAKDHALLLAGVTFDHRILFHKIPASYPLEVFDLLSGKFLMQANWNSKHKKFAVSPRPAQGPPVGVEVFFKSGIKSAKRVTPSILKWQQAPVTGKIAHLLAAWQESAVIQQDSLGTAQVLTFLVSFYYEAYKVYSSVNSNESKLLRDYGIRISEQNLSQKDLPRALHLLTNTYRTALSALPSSASKIPRAVYNLEYETLR